MQAGQPWHVLRVDPKKYALAALDAVAQGFEIYVPEITTRRLVRNKRVTLQHLAIDRIIFLKFTAAAPYWDSSTVRGADRLILTTQGLPWRVTDGEINRLSDELDIINASPSTRSPLSYAPGTMLKILSGALAGATGRCVSQKNNRLLIAIPCFAGETVVATKSDLVAVAS